MDFGKSLEILKKDIIFEIMSLFNRNDKDTAKATEIHLGVPYMFRIEHFHPENEDCYERIMIIGVRQDGQLISTNMDGEKRTLFFDDLCADDLVNVHSLFKGNEIIYVF